MTSNEIEETLKDPQVKMALSERGFMRAANDPKSTEEFTSFVAKESSAMKAIAADIEKEISASSSGNGGIPPAPAATTK